METHGLSPSISSYLSRLILLLPADRNIEMEIEASKPSTFTLHVLTPNNYPEAHFGPITTSPAANYRVTVTPRGVELDSPGY